MKWVAAWGCAESLTPASVCTLCSNTTLQYEIYIGIDGEAIRLHFSNRYGGTNLYFDSITVRHNGEIKNVSVNTKKQVNISKHECVVTDTIEMHVKAGDKLIVSMFFNGIIEMSTGRTSSGPLVKGCFARGDFTNELYIPAKESLEFNTYYFLTGIDVLAQDNTNALLAFGDSITNQSWPDWLTLRLLETNKTNLSVIRCGIGGNRVLGEYQDLRSQPYGERGTERLKREIDRCGIDRIIVLHGVNDIIHPMQDNELRPWSQLPTAEEIIDGYRAYISIAHERGVKIYFATITPINGWKTYLPVKEEIRRKVNCWILNNNEADGAIDFATAICDPDDQTKQIPDYNCGDGLHPSLLGGKMLAYSIPESILE